MVYGVLDNKAILSENPDYVNKRESGIIGKKNMDLLIKYHNQSVFNASVMHFCNFSLFMSLWHKELLKKKL